MTQVATQGSKQTAGRGDDRRAEYDRLRQEIHHFAHMLSEQGPMNITFVHNNTLLGLQHLHFDSAIWEAHRVLGARGYDSLEKFRDNFDAGRITDRDLRRALDDREDIQLGAPLLGLAGRSLSRREVLYTDLRYGCDGLPFAALEHFVKHRGGLKELPGDAPASLREQLRTDATHHLETSVAGIGERQTLSQWLEAVTGLALQSGCVALAASALARGVVDDIDPERLLERLAVNPPRHDAYLRQVDACMNEVPEGAGKRMRRVAFLAAEVDQLDAICRRHFGVAGRIDALYSHFRANPEHYRVQICWVHLCQQFGVDDPFSPTEALGLSPASTAPDSAERARDLAAFGKDHGSALPALLQGDLYARLEGALDRLAAEAADSVHSSDVTGVRANLRNDALGAQGLAALQRLAAADPDPALAELVGQVAARDAVRMRQQWAGRQIERDIAMFEEGRTHSDWIFSLSGVDLVDQVNDYMIRLCAAFTDEGLSAWRMPDRGRGFYHCWRALVLEDARFSIEGLEGWREMIENLPLEPEETILRILGELGVPAAARGEYLGRMLAQLKGWAGITFWYELHPRHYKQAVHPTDTVQYLAVRLVYEFLLVRKTCQQLWGLDGHLEGLQRYLILQPSEYLLRLRLHAGVLDDEDADAARRALSAPQGPRRSLAIARLADLVWLRECLRQPLELAAGTVWRLHRLTQLLGLSLDEIHALDRPGLDTLLAELDGFPEPKKAPIWLDAYESHYRDEILNALAQNAGRGRWAKGRTRRPRSQLVLCIDEREENLHRHYGELDPEHETLGAAGFFGVAQAYSGLDDHEAFPRCPAVATPAHRIFEIPRAEALQSEYPVHKRRQTWKEVFDGTFWETKRNPVSSFFLFQLWGLFMALPLIGRVFAPGTYGRLASALRNAVIPPVRTRLTHLRVDDEMADALKCKSSGLPVGFDLTEAADRVEAQLRNWGLTYQFARIVVCASHRSISVNNPHENAHDCGACSGKPGGANARLFAALANDSRVRDLLRERDIDIPDDTWFVGAEHNTASSAILTYDTEDIPAPLQADWQLVCADLDEARKRAARERCRRFASAPKDASLEASIRHVEARTEDLSQVRPEWGHCTNAFAMVGRRCLTQGLFFDRRGFIISYDPTQDDDGKILERILLAVGPVGAGINLEYYFSTVDPDRFGCGTKVPHNVTGLIGVMAGAHSDLQTGLPRQMTEIHEAMRLQLIVDGRLEHLGEIYGRNPGIQQLLDNQWVHLIAHVPDTGELHRFVPGKGFVQWQESLEPIPEVSESFEWFKGKYECFLSPARIAEPTRRWNEQATG